MIESIHIPERYAGPPFAANGGYLAGALAARAGLSTAHIELKAPMPLGVDIDLALNGITGAALANGATIASVSPVSLLRLDHPQVDAEAAERAVIGLDASTHPFPDCFVCGPNRPDNTGLHLLPGRVDDGVYATPWRPLDWQTDDEGFVRLPFMTAALDCPSAFPVMQPGASALLAAMTFEVNRLARRGERLVVTGWRHAVHGRKMRAGTVITDARGDVLARAMTLWIGVDQEKLQALAAWANAIANDVTKGAAA